MFSSLLLKTGTYVPTLVRNITIHWLFQPRLLRGPFQWRETNFFQNKTRKAYIAYRKLVCACVNGHNCGWRIHYSTHSARQIFQYPQGKNKMKLASCFSVHIKTNSQWNNLKGRITRDENIGRFPYDLRVRKNLLRHKEKSSLIWWCPKRKRKKYRDKERRGESIKQPKGKEICVQDKFRKRIPRWVGIWGTRNINLTIRIQS